MAFAWLTVAILAGLQSTTAAGTGAQHWEWSAIFEFAEAGLYTWSAARGADGSYADPSMKLAILPAPGATEAALESLEEAAEHIWANPVTVPSGAMLSTGSAYTLEMNQNNWVSHWQVVIRSPGKVAFFAEHFPTEFENGFHFIRTKEGTDVEALVESPEGSHSHDHGGHDGHDGPDEHEGHSDAEEHEGYGHGEEQKYHEEHEGHCPWSHEWEWAGIYNLQAAGTFDWSAARRGGEYANPTMRLLVLQADNATEAALEALQHNAHERWEEGFSVVEAGSTLSVGSAYILSFDQLSWVSHFSVSIPTPGAVAFFAQYPPPEFESDFHYFKSASGINMEPAVEESAANCWGKGDEADANSEYGDHRAWRLGGSARPVLPALLDVVGILQGMVLHRTFTLQYIEPPEAIIPNAHARLGEVEREQRYRYFTTLIAFTGMVHFLLGTTFLMIRNAYATSPPSREVAVAEYDLLEAASSTAQRDVALVITKHTWVVPCVVAWHTAVTAGLLAYFVFRGAVGGKFGVAWEFWALWLNVGMVSGYLEILVLAARPRGRPLNLYAKAMCLVHAPLISERMDTCKDMIFISVVAQAGWTMLAVVCAILLIGSHYIFLKREDTRGELAETYLPILLSPPQEAPGSGQSEGAHCAKLQEEAALLILKQASEGRRVISIYEDVPQAAAMIVFTLGHGGSPFVFCSLVISLCRLFLSSDQVGGRIYRYFLGTVKQARSKACVGGNAGKVLALTRQLWNIDATIPALELKAVGYDAGHLRGEGLLPAQLMLAGYTGKELRESGFTARELKDGGFLARELKDGGFGPDCRAAFLAAHLQRLEGFTLAEAMASGWTAAELTPLYCRPVVAAGGRHSLVVQEDGTVIAFGHNDDGQATVPDLGGRRAVHCAAGWGHSLLVLEDGSAVAFGNNDYRKATVPDLAGRRAVHCAAGQSHSLLVLEDGSAVAFGWNRDGQAEVPSHLTGGEVPSQLEGGGGRQKPRRAWPWAR